MVLTLSRDMKLVSVDDPDGLLGGTEARREGVTTGFCVLVTVGVMKMRGRGTVTDDSCPMAGEGAFTGKFSGTCITMGIMEG